MQEAGTRLGIIGLEFEIITVGVCGFGLFLSIEAFRKSLALTRAIWLDFQRAPESCFSFRRLACAQSAPPEVVGGGDVVGIQMQQRVKAFRRGGPVPRAVQRHSEQISRPALCWKQLHGFAQRSYRGGVLLRV